MFEPDPCRFTRAQAGYPESLNALLRQHEGLVQAAQSPERQAIERCAFGTGAVGGEHIDDSILQPREYRTRCVSPG